MMIGGRNSGKTAYIMAVAISSSATKGEVVHLLSTSPMAKVAKDLIRLGYDISLTTNLITVRTQWGKAKIKVLTCPRPDPNS